MNTQTFRSTDVMTALEDVQKKLGPDAIVLSVRQVPPGPVWQVWRSPEVEVVAMSSKTASTAEKTPQAASTPKPAPQLRSPELPKTQATTHTQDAPATKQSNQAIPMSLPPSLANMRQKLLSQGVDSALVGKVINTSLETLSPRALKDDVRLFDFISHQLQAFIRCRSSAQEILMDRVVCVTGMSGSGKTTTIAKLAAYHSKTLGRKVAWVCADTISAGAIAQSRLYTDALGINLHLAYTPDDLAIAVKSEADADLILVDTPACNPYQESSVIELGDFLSVLRERTTFLVASANSKDTDLNKIQAALGPFNLKGLIITHLDTTGSFGNVINLAWRSQTPLVYFSAGPRVPDDLKPAQAIHLIASMFSEGWVK